MDPTEADYIVIGAGSTGCVLARRLSADPEAAVILLWAGGRDWTPWIHIPVGYFKTMHNPSVDWCYRTEPDPGLNGRQLDWPRGKVPGGSSSLNGLLHVRGRPEDYDRWRRMGSTGWRWDDLLPLFRRSEDQERGGRVSRRRRAAAGVENAAATPDLRRLGRGGANRGLSVQPGLQRRRAGRRRLLPADIA